MMEDNSDNSRPGGLETPGRFSIPEREELSARQQEMLDAFRRFSLNGDRGPFKVMLLSPDAAEHFQALGKYLRFDSALSDRLVELAVLVHARMWNDQYEWYLHAPRAIEAGLPAATVEALKYGRIPQQLNEKEAAVFNFVRALEQDRKVDDGVFAEAVRFLGKPNIADLVFMLGQYATISMLLAVAEEGRDLTILPVCPSPFASAQS